MSEAREISSHLLAPTATIEGILDFKGTLRFEGRIKGEIRGAPESLLVIGETAVIEGAMRGDRIVVRGYVAGDIEATATLRLEGTARVIGNLKAPSLEIEVGAVWEGRSSVNPKTKPEANANPKPILA